MTSAMTSAMMAGMGCLPGNTEGQTDLFPGRTIYPGFAHKVAFQLGGQMAKLGYHPKAIVPTKVLGFLYC